MTDCCAEIASATCSSPAIRGTSADQVDPVKEETAPSAATNSISGTTAWRKIRGMVMATSAKPPQTRSCRESRWSTTLPIRPASSNWGIPPAASNKPTSYGLAPCGALAHPARMAVIDALASGDELTATECAALTGLSPSATAYHLNLLARYGFAEPAPARGDARERPWRASDRRAHVNIDTSTPAGAAAAATVGVAYIERTREVAEQWATNAHTETREWQDVPLLANVDLWLTPDETRALTTALSAAIAPYRGRSRPKGDSDVRRVRVMNVVIPHRQH